LILDQYNKYKTGQYKLSKKENYMSGPMFVTIFFIGMNMLALSVAHAILIPMGIIDCIVFVLAIFNPKNIMGGTL